MKMRELKSHNFINFFWLFVGKVYFLIIGMLVMYSWCDILISSIFIRCAGCFLSFVSILVSCYVFQVENS